LSAPARSAPGRAEPGLGRALLLGLRALARERRGGELHVLAAALLVAVASLAAVGFLAERVQGAMRGQAAELLAGDVRVSSRDPIPERVRAAAHRHGLETARTLTFRSMLAAGERFQLVEVKAVTPGYPLRGELRVAETPFGRDRPAQDVPAPGTAWVDPRLASLLELEPGSPLTLGETQLRLGRILSQEPDRGGELFSIAPRLLMNQADVPATGLVRAGSRVRHRLLVAGAPSAVRAFREAVASELPPGAELEGLENARPEIRRALERGRQFLGLAALVGVLLAGAAIAVSARRHAQRHLDAAALMRCLGARQRTVLGIYTAELAALGVVVSLLGCAAGYLAQLGLAALVGDLLLAELPPASGRTVLFAAPAGLAILGAFALPPVLRLGRVPPLRALRRELGPPAVGAGVTYALGVAVFGALALWHTRDPRLTAYVLGGGLLTLAGLTGAALALVYALGRLRGRVGVAWRFGLANIARRAGASAGQVAAFGLGIMALLLLTVVRTDLLAEWRDTVPADAPNFFLINIQPDEVQSVREHLAPHVPSELRLYPIVRGRLGRIADRTVSPEDYTDKRARHLATHDFNLSWTQRLPAGNRVVAGQWWGGSGEPEAAFSLEEGLAERLRIELGDTLAFNVAGETVQGRVTSLRAVDWDSFQANFFVLAPPGMLEGYPATYITSFFLPRERTPMLAELVGRFPSVTVVDVDALVEKVRTLMERAVLGVEGVFVFTLLAGLTVLYAAIHATLDERRTETAVVRALGGDRRRLVRGLAAEFVTLGLVSGLVAATGAALVGTVLARELFEVAYRPDPWIWIAGAAAGALGVGAAGVLGTRGVLNEPPAAALRRV